MKFQFRFHSLLELRRRERDEAAAAVAQALQAIAKIEQQWETVVSERTLLRQHAAQQLHGPIVVDSLLVHGRYDLQLHTQAQSLLHTREQLNEELQRRRRRLVDAEAEVKRFERLQEHDRRGFARALARREQFEADDRSAQRYSRVAQERSTLLHHMPLREHDQ